MPESLSFVLIHVIFSTKDRAPLLKDPVQQELHAYLATMVRNRGCDCFRVGGVADHVHLAIRLSRTLDVAKLVAEIKASSSKWLKTRGVQGFAWQRGYAAFSVSPSDREALGAYIDGQVEHHRKVDYKKEYQAFLVKYGVDFDERYVWD